MRSPDRIDGWKAIGAHFGRDRSTAMRWAQTRGLPIRRIPGGKLSTVYALRSELDLWAEQNADAELAAAPEADPSARAAPGGRPRRRRIVAAAVAALVVLGVGVAVSLRKSVSVAPVPVGAASQQALPADPDVATLYVQARDDWARRTPTSLARAVTALEAVTRRDPTFAPGFAALADSYLLASEFGFMADEDAFPKAKAAAMSALRLAPDLAAGHRSLGFVLYWWENDPVASGRAFRRALQQAPNSAQTHFWYGNVLSDNGAHAAAARELNQARLLEPGSVAIQNDLAWAHWRAGRNREARQGLLSLIDANPRYSAAYDCLATLALSEGDYAGYVQYFARYAALREDPSLIARASAQAQALDQGAAVFEQLLLATTLDRAGKEIGRSLAGAAFVASLANNRTALIDILERADQAGEVWGASGERERMRRRWAADVEVMDLLSRRTPPAAG